MSGFDQLHPSLQHHIVNTLGWPALRPLQDAAVEPLVAGEHGMLLAPTAGGKTEAASFPILSRMATEEWKPLSVLYLAPLRALLNNLLPRLELYTSFVGRSAKLWHGDTSQSERARIISDPPDLLLTTPESLEAMLISRRVNQDWLFPNLRTVIIDEVHAFAAADRGWHLVSVLERLSRVAGRDLQRVGLSATVGNPGELLEWFCGASAAPRRILNPPAESVAEPEVEIDFVGNLENAATVIDRLHRGEKRLVFVDSRRRVEELGTALNDKGTTAFVSHGSLGREERHRSEQAFAEAQDCVIVSTSTLELGIDVGDLDRVIQIDAPSTVASFLQRIGRTGRRAGSSRNCLFLTTSDDAFLGALGLVRLWGQGYVEPATAPVLPIHVATQQLMALTLQEADNGLVGSEWQDWLGSPSVLGEATERAAELMPELLAGEWLHDDGGLLSPGQKAEKTIGRRNFLELTSVFVADPVISMRQGRTEIGQLPDYSILAAFESTPPRVLLAGRRWRLVEIDWKRRVAQIEPEEDQARLKFPPSVLPWSFELCQAIADVLGGAELAPATLTKRAQSRLTEARMEFPGAQAGRTLLLRTDSGLRWYTFAGLRANLELAARLAPLRTQIGQKNNLYITLDDWVGRQEIKAALANPTPIDELTKLVRNVGTPLKLRRLLPDSIIDGISVARLRDLPAVDWAVSADVQGA